MADTPETKPPFWTSLQGILTGVGAVIVALTGLVTALYSTGAIGSKANSNAAPPANAPVTLASAPSPSSDNDRYKALAGKWEITEEPSQDYANVESVTWQYNAVVSGNVLTLTGKISAIDGDKNLDKDDARISATYVTTLIGLSGIGEYRLKKINGTTVINTATIQFEDDLTKFEGKIDVKGQETYTLTGHKQ